MFVVAVVVERRVVWTDESFPGMYFLLLGCDKMTGHLICLCSVCVQRIAPTMGAAKMLFTFLRTQYLSNQCVCSPLRSNLNDSPVHLCAFPSSFSARVCVCNRCRHACKRRLEVCIYCHVNLNRYATLVSVKFSSLCENCRLHTYSKQ